MGLGLGAPGETGATPSVGAGVGRPGVVGLGGPPLSSLENLLGNIQNLLKVATESVRHEERQKGSTNILQKRMNLNLKVLLKINRIIFMNKALTNSIFDHKLCNLN